MLGSRMHHKSELHESAIIGEAPSTKAEAERLRRAHVKATERAIKSSLKPSTSAAESRSGARLDHQRANLGFKLQRLAKMERK